MGLPCVMCYVDCWQGNHCQGILQHAACAAGGRETTRSHQTGYVKPMPIYCWADVGDGGPTLNRHWFNVSCLLGSRRNLT